MANTQSAKGNPASKRMQNKNLKARRARSWERGQRRKEARIDAAQRRADFNNTLRRDGIALYGPEGRARRAAAGFKRGHN